MNSRVAIDLDGTFCENHWPSLGPPKPGAVEAMLNMMEFCTPFIFTSRIAPCEIDEYTPRLPHVVHAEKLAIRQMLDDYGLHGVELWTKPWKPGAAVYLDDKAVRFPGKWRRVPDIIKAHVEAAKR